MKDPSLREYYQIVILLSPYAKFASITILAYVGLLTEITFTTFGFTRSQMKCFLFKVNKTAFEK